MFSEKDTILQMSRCSFDIHVEDILGALIIGATLVMLRPDGLMDLPYLVNIFEVKMITYLNSVPSYLEVLCRYLERQSGESSSNYLRCVCSSGKYIKIYEKRN
jgi:non-ribosomal peptide synthetase component F